LLEKLDRIAKSHNTTVSAVSLAWLRQQPTVSAPIASATNLEQIKEIMPIITLADSELKELSN
ncbi:MAG: aldo/keto reductase, partial [Actinomycetota bacterium]